MKQEVEKTKGTSTPFILALLLCDSVIVDETSKKKTLVGIFDRILVRRFPSKHHPITIYARLTDAEGLYDFRIEYVQIETDKRLAEGKITGVSIPSRLQKHDLILQPPPVPIPEPGEYEFRLWANDRYIGRVSFVAVQVTEKGG